MSEWGVKTSGGKHVPMQPIPVLPGEWGVRGLAEHTSGRNEMTSHQCSLCLRWFGTEAELASHATALTKPCVRYDLDAISYWLRASVSHDLLTNGRNEMKATAGDIIVLAGKTQKGKNRVREHGERWLVREVDNSTLGRNLGYLICPASYVGTDHLNPEYDTPSSLYQVNGYARWVKPVRDEHFDVVDVERAA